MKLGLTLPLVGGIAVVEAAYAAEELGVDGVFLFDHYSTKSRPESLAANDPFVLLGALASATTQMFLGSLVYRAASTPVGVSEHAFRSLMDFAGDRLIAGIGIGGHEIEDELRNFSVSCPSYTARVQTTAKLARMLTSAGVCTWVGGSSIDAEGIALRNGAGLNLWNAGLAAFGARARKAIEQGIKISWAGPWAASSLRSDGGTALIHHFESLRATGASWAVIAPIGLTAMPELRAAYRRILECWQSAP